MSVRRTTLAAAAGFVAIATLGGCFPSNPLTEHRVEFRDTAQSTITEIQLSPGAGDLTVRTAPDRKDVGINRVVRYHSGDPEQATYRIEGGVLHLDTDCGRRCSVSYDILAPQGVTVRGENGSGNVTLTDVAAVDMTVGSGEVTVSGATGTVRVETGSGNIDLSSVSGEVTAHAGSGDVEGRELGGGRQVRVETGSGNITLALASPGSVQARASSGEVELSVPAGSYQVRTSSSSGTVHSDVPNDPAATAVLDASTGSGNITVRQR